MRFDLSITIRRPPAEVFTALADMQRYERQDPRPAIRAMEETPAGPTRLGARWREVVRLAPFLRTTVWSTVTAITRDQQLELTVRSAMFHGTLTYWLEPVYGGTLLRQDEVLHPKGPFRLVPGWMEYALGQRLQQRLEEIRDLLEQGGVDAL